MSDGRSSSLKKRYMTLIPTQIATMLTTTQSRNKLKASITRKRPRKSKRLVQAFHLLLRNFGRNIRSPPQTSKSIIFTNLNRNTTSQIRPLETCQVYRSRLKIAPRIMHCTIRGTKAVRVNSITTISWSSSNYSGIASCEKAPATI